MRTFFALLLLVLPVAHTTVNAFFVGTQRTFVPKKIDPASSLLAHESEDIQEEPSRAKQPNKLDHAGEEESLLVSSNNNKRFATGKELKNLRTDLTSLRHNLLWAEAVKDDTGIKSLAKAIKNGENRDPDLMYDKAIRLIGQAKMMKDATDEEKEALTEKWTKIATEARKILPQFNLEGLWVGSYGEHGAQVINITYTDDTITATKVTDGRNVPRGETSFTANLSPNNKNSALPPIQLDSTSEHQSGKLQRFPGRGQVSRKGFKDNRYVEGQMVLFGDDAFSFVWIPTKHHIMFTRPSPEMTLRLLRDTLSKEDELENMRDHVTRCFDMDLSTCIARQQDPTNFEPLRRIALQDDLDEAQKRIKQHNDKNIFWRLNKWRKYIDQSLGSK